MKPNCVYNITYECRDIGYGGVESGEIRAYWTGEIDTWGKYTIVPVDGSERLYLFQDEILNAGPPCD